MLLGRLEASGLKADPALITGSWHSVALAATCGARDTHRRGEVLFVPLQGAEPGRDLQQGHRAQLRAAANETPVVLQAQAEERLVTDLGRKDQLGSLQLRCLCAAHHRSTGRLSVRRTD